MGIRHERLACIDEPLPDRSDEPFLEVALAAGVPLVTGNLRHYPPKLRRGVEVLSPAEYVKKYRA